MLNLRRSGVAGAVRDQPARRAERPRAGDRDQLRDPGAGRVAAWPRCDRVLQRTLGRRRHAGANGREVNHQWSKGFAFETLLGRLASRPCGGGSRILLAAAPAVGIGRDPALRQLDATTRCFRPATAISTSSASGRRSAGAGSARSATSCSSRWRRSCQSRAYHDFRPQSARRCVAGRRLRRAARMARPQALRVRGRGPRVARGDGGTGAAARVARGCVVARFARESCRRSIRRTGGGAAAGRRRAPHPAGAWGACSMQLAELEGNRVAVWGEGREGRAASRLARRAPQPVDHGVLPGCRSRPRARQGRCQSADRDGSRRRQRCAASKSS